MKYAFDLWYFMPVPFGFGIKGIPDFIGCYKGWFFAIETKAGGNKLTPWQVRIMDAIKLAGGKYYVVRCKEDLDDLFREA
jgi:hypothetical protein